MSALALLLAAQISASPVHVAPAPRAHHAPANYFGDLSSLGGLTFAPAPSPSIEPAPAPATELPPPAPPAANVVYVDPPPVLAPHPARPRVTRAKIIYLRYVRPAKRLPRIVYGAA